VKEALGFLMTREISHQMSFEKALYSMQPNFPPGKLPGMKEFDNVYFNMSNGDGDTRGPWNNDASFRYREIEPAVDGGSGLPEVHLDSADNALVERMAMRTRSDPQSNPPTGAELGMSQSLADGGGTGKGPKPAPKGGRGAGRQ
jgi:Mn-containing catalase